MPKLPLSVSIISFNEEENIEQTLRAIADIASEIIIVDSFSEDRTVEIAKNFDAKVFLEEWKGHISQKNSALEKCTQKWILSLDCDEVVTPELKASIVEAIQKDKKIGYYLDRRTYYLGKLLKRSWRPDWKLRLVHRDCNPRWEGLDPHDELVVNCSTTKLKGTLLHYPYKSLKQHFEKTIYYANLSAQSYHRLGRKFHLYHLLVNPIFSFVKLYFVNLGFADGIRGLLAGISAFVSTFLKYAFLWEIELQEKSNGRDNFL
jgi:glycosyltransferase involved in cell wall biosynthesis